jgi:hypothetical protein
MRFSADALRGLVDELLAPSSPTRRAMRDADECTFPHRALVLTPSWAKPTTCCSHLSINRDILQLV